MSEWEGEGFWIVLTKAAGNEIANIAILDLMGFQKCFPPSKSFMNMKKLCVQNAKNIL